MKQSLLILSFLLTHLFSSTAQINITNVGTFDGKGDFSDRYNCITTDASGNVYLGGSTVREDFNRDYLIEKRDQQGTLVWRYIIGAPGNGPDEVKDIVTDAAGNVYVTGYGNNVGVGNDYFTIKFNSNGDTLWTRLYNDANYNQYDQANSIALDNAGNVVITGESDRDPSSITNDDFLTVKYSTDGNLLWAVRFNDSGNTTDRGEKVLTDASGNIYVTGRSNNGADDDYCTIKYNASGVQQWIQFLDFGGTDRATDMGMDAAGNVYVTGRRDNGADDDYCTVKYSPTGALLQTSVFDFVEDDRAEAIAVAADGSFVVTGRSDNNATALLNYDYYTVKYNSSGVQQWAKAHNGTGNGDDWGVDVAISSSGKVMVTGFADGAAGAAIVNDFTTLCYDNAGNVIFNYTPSSAFEQAGTAVTFGLNETPWACGSIATASNDRDAAAMTFNTNNVASTFTYNGQGDKSDNVRDWYIDASNNIYAAGYSVNLDRDRDFSLVKFNANGDTLWSRHLSGTLYGSDEEANSIAVDGTGNIVVSGYVKNSGTSSDILLAKYNASGTLLDTLTWNNTFNEADRSLDMAVDASNNIYLTGRTDIDPSSTSNDEIIVIKFSSAFAQLWRYVYPGTGSGSDRGKFIHANADGTGVVASRLTLPNGSQNMVLFKLNANGTLAWQVTYDGNGGNDDVQDMLVTADGTIYLAVNSESAFQTAKHNIALLAYSNSGALLWSQIYDGANNEDDVVADLSIGYNGILYITGSSNTGSAAAPNYDAVAMAYTGTGALLWMHAFNNPNGLDDIADAITSDENGDVMISYHTNNGSTQVVDYDARLHTILSDGTLGPNATYAASDSAQVINYLRLQNGQLLAAGSTWLDASQRDMLVLQGGYSVNMEETQIAPLRIYPNPTSDAVWVEVPHSSEMWQCTLYTVLGQQVKTEPLKGSRHRLDLQSLPTGVYMLQLRSNNGHVITEKITLNHP